MDNKYTVLWEAILNNTELTTKNLKELGYSKPSKLIEEGILIRVKRGFYQIANITDFYSYGKGQIKTNKEKFLSVINRSLELNPNFGPAVFQLFFDSLKKEDYESCFNYLSKLIEIDSPEYTSDHNLYLVLLSNLTELPDNLKRKLVSVKLEDVLISSLDLRYDDYEYENAIRIALYERKYGFAFSLLRNSEDKTATMSVYYAFLKIKSKEKKQDRKNFVKEMIKAKDYNKLKEHLQTNKDTLLEKLVDKYLSILQTSEVPVTKPIVSNKLGVLIKTNNFKKALDLALNIEQFGPDSPVVLVLEDINSLIDKITEEKNKVYTFDDVFKALINQENYLEVLRRYLGQINKPEYEELLLNFIKLGVYEEDFSYMIFFRHLFDLSNNRLNINFNSYLKYFNEDIQAGELESAEIYLDIIKSGQRLGINDININQLEYNLNNAKLKAKRNKMLAIIANALNEVINNNTAAILDSKDVTLSILENSIKGKNILIEPVKDKYIIRYFSKQYIDIKGILYNISDYFNKGAYEECINSAMIILNSVTNIKPFVYQNLGMSHYYLGHLDEALKFLTIASLYGYNNNSIISDIKDLQRRELELKRELKKEEGDN
ncbi:MAG: type IV toxin-antitoxin system AbiEi family antitoxin domain-containing protein [Ruminococcus sp.]|nr:type IV toxin-antitoxin system AbiEi family antitoxin domain-containing protein [Ruminococcus sp.]